MSNTYTGKIAKSPKITDKSIFFVLEPENAKSLAIIGFFKSLDADYIAELRQFELNQEVTFLGREHTNNKSGAKEIIIEGPVVKEMTVEEALMMPDPNLAPVEERTLPDHKYSFKHPKSKEEIVFWSDGIYFWTQGNKSDKRKLNYDFINTYNSYVKSDKWLMPDWYTIEVAKANATSKALTDEFAVY